MAEGEVVIGGGGPKDVAKLIRAIDGAERILAKRFGAQMVSTSKKAFDEQKFGAFRWPAKYEGKQPKPFISVAGAVADFAAGRTKPRAYQLLERPAIQDRGFLQRSISFRMVGPGAVEVGTVMDYANVHQTGGISTQPIDDATRDRIADWLGRRSRKRVHVPGDVSDQEFAQWARARNYVVVGKLKTGKQGLGKRASTLRRGRMKTVTEEKNAAYEPALGWIVAKAANELTTKIHARPFIGVTEEDSRDFAEIVTNFIVERGGGPPPATAAVVT